ncbi:MAG: nicotinate phosphoribosyltransferase [Candidatus Anstonellales archaeon]
MKLVTRRSLNLLIDFYEFTMADSYYQEKKEKEATFDLFVRKLPKNRSYLIACGVYDALKYIQNLRFEKNELSYLRSTGRFSDGFLKYLSNFKFSGDVYGIPEGTPVFEMEPILRVTAPLIEAQLLETFLLNCVGFQTLIATKASRICTAALNKPVIDFGLRRSQGIDAGLKAARAAFIGGCSATSNVLAGKEYNIPISGTVAHSFILSYKDEFEAFKSIARRYGDGCVFLIDTYNPILGAKNAVKVAKEMEKEGKRAGAVRIDSGDLSLLSKRVRKLLDSAGLSYIKIIASGGLDEYKIDRLLNSRSPIDAFGVGTSMDVSDDAPSLDINYKLCEYDGKPVQKTSEGKATLAGKKNVLRFEKDGKFIYDLIVGDKETKKDGSPLLVQMIRRGKIIFKVPQLVQIRANAKKQLTKLPSAVLSVRHPKKYPVKISTTLLS